MLQKSDASHHRIQAQVADRRKKQLQDQKKKQEQQTYTPAISVHSAALHREGKVGDRLYNEWKKREEEKLESHPDEEEELPSHRPKVG